MAPAAGDAPDEVHLARLDDGDAVARLARALRGRVDEEVGVAIRTGTAFDGEDVGH
jgi:hypothetical protein